MVYVPAWRAGSGSTSLCIRTDTRDLIEAVNREANAIDSAIPILRTRTASETWTATSCREYLEAPQRCFGLLALLLGGKRLYSVMAHSVARRTREISYPHGAGCGKPRGVWMVLRDALIMRGGGGAIGIPGRAEHAKFASSLLFGRRGGRSIQCPYGHPVLGGVAVVASFLPAPASQPHRSRHGTAGGGVRLPNNEQVRPCIAVCLH